MPDKCTFYQLGNGLNLTRPHSNLGASIPHRRGDAVIGDKVDVSISTPRRYRRITAVARMMDWVEGTKAQLMLAMPLCRLHCCRGAIRHNRQDIGRRSTIAGTTHNVQLQACPVTSPPIRASRRNGSLTQVKAPISGLAMLNVLSQHRARPRYARLTSHGRSSRLLRLED